MGETGADEEDSPIVNQNRVRFFKSSLRAMRPGGYLLMVEKPINRGSTKDQQPFYNELKEAGFSKVLHGKVRAFVTRRHLDRFLRSTASQIPEDYLRSAESLIGIIAVA